MVTRERWKKSVSSLKSLANAFAKLRPRLCEKCGIPRASASCTASWKSKIRLPSELRFADVGLHHFEEIFQRVIFAHEAVGSPEHRLLNQIFRAGHSRQHNHRKLRKICLKETQKLEPVFARQIDVEDREIK